VTKLTLPPTTLAADSEVASATAHAAMEIIGFMGN